MNVRIAKVSSGWSALILWIWKALYCDDDTSENMITQDDVAWSCLQSHTHTLTSAVRSVWRCRCSCCRRGCTRGTEPTPADPVYELLLHNPTDGEPEPRVCSAAWSNSPNRPHLWRSETHESFRKHIHDWHFKIKPKRYSNEIKLSPEEKTIIIIKKLFGLSFSTNCTN